MKNILVTYISMAGSTAEVARTVAEEITRSGAQVEVRPIAEVASLQGYDGVVLGAPLIMGWHRAALAFLRRHRREFQSIPLHIFIMGLSLTQTPEISLPGVSLSVDPGLPKPPLKPGRLSFRERYATLQNYTRPILGVLRPARPASIGIFGGRLEYGRLKPWAVLFVMLIIRAAAGDRRNWESIRAWAGGLFA